MTAEEKQLLLIDLCARLTYGVICKINTNENIILKDIFIDGAVGNKGQLGFGMCKYDRIFQELEDIKPYLRPLSSMTEEEREYHKKLSKNVKHGGNIDLMLEFYLSHYLDWRGLIEKGLALEAPEGMYKFD